MLPLVTRFLFPWPNTIQGTAFSFKALASQSIIISYHNKQSALQWTVNIMAIAINF